MPTLSFLAHVENLCEVAETVGSAAAIPGVRVRSWAIPDGYPSDVPLYDPAGIATACDRTDLNALVVEAYNTAGPNAGRLGTVVAGKMALDHVACRERALHARHATPLRLRAWAAARRAGHADTLYGVFGAFAASVNDVSAAATAVDNTQT